MEIRIQALHFDAADRLQEFIRKKVSKLEKYSDRVNEADVVLKVIKPEVANNKEASIKLTAKSGDFFASKVGDTFEEAVDLAVEALEKQIIRFKEKITTK